VPKILAFLGQMEALTWAEIDGMVYSPKNRPGHTRNHAISVERLSREARRRLEELELGDLADLYCFRVSFRGRLWGARLPGSEVFHILWWDADHRVYPLG
jgi:hypothetical protein